MELLTVEEVARILGLHEETVRRRIREGTIPGARNIGSGIRPTIRVDAFEFRSWLRNSNSENAR